MQADHNRVQIQNGLPVFSKNIQAYIPFQVDIRVIDLEAQEVAMRRCGTRLTIHSRAYLGYAFHFWRFVWVVGVDSE